MENIEIVDFYCNDPDIEKIGELYCVTFLPDNFSIKDKENAIKNIKKHTNYQGFIGLKAKDNKGDIIGFTYGYTSLPEQFYREKIANRLSKVEIGTWLFHCFELVELAVHPSYKCLGIASKLHDNLLKNVNLKTAVLTTSIENNPAINLYRKKGWEIIKNNAPVISKEHLQVIMGKVLI
ncbi:GNAT family N-acetyltransferase [Gracilibacillus sp. S3-1-1]|uniref:GNAT family N-acetyltransferase n=1 Tax=Gracilibacillus pellucidus TaxID=3095368 RepID=A0ACC6M5J3_9BACI|nr:GNAT family N-acetyltransferase [Gracilibacillus sp. S3-1-1]MDX8046258.1 GNAT family N-acetyltransferase [Gracilibacillus sp. S3-1-1]